MANFIRVANDAYGNQRYINKDRILVVTVRKQTRIEKWDVTARMAGDSEDWYLFSGCDDEPLAISLAQSLMNPIQHYDGLDSDTHRKFYEVDVK